MKRRGFLETNDSRSRVKIMTKTQALNLFVGLILILGLLLPLLLPQR